MLETSLVESITVDRYPPCLKSHPLLKLFAGRPVRGKASTLPVLLNLWFTAIIIGKAGGDVLK